MTKSGKNHTFQTQQLQNKMLESAANGKMCYLLWNKSLIQSGMGGCGSPNIQMPHILEEESPQR